MEPSEKERQVFQFTDSGEPLPERLVASPIATLLAPGSVIDSRYEIECVIGEGGCGCVYKVKQVVLKKHFALKTLNPVAVSKLTMLRLQKEAEAASKLDHPNVVRAIDFGLINDTQPFLVMDYVMGPTLAQHLSERGRIPAEEAVRIFLPICEALAHAHREGVVHRDIKPSNIMLDTSKSQAEFVPKIVDFGIAKLQFAHGNSPALTATGEIFGTPLYMSPEQCLGSGVDHRSDIYSLGCVLFEALTGAPPFTGSNALELMMQHGSASIPSMREASLGLNISPALEAIVAKMLRKDMRERYQNFSDVAADLAAFQRGEISPKQIDSLPAAKSGEHHYKVVLGLSVLILIIAVGTLSYFAGASRQPIVVAPVPQKMTDLDVAKDTVKTITTTAHMHNRNAATQLGITGSMKSFGEPRLCYWDSTNQLQKVPVRDVKKIPAQAKVIYVSWGMLTLKPSQWNDFAANLVGISTNIGVDFVLPINLDQRPHLSAITSRRNLRLLSLRSADFEPGTWMALGAMPALHWLWLYHVQINHEDITGAQMAKLANLNNLKVLSIDSITEPNPMLSALEKSDSLRRLSLGDTTLDTAGARSIAHIPHLQILRLRTVAIKEPAVFDELARAPELKSLCLIEETHIPNEATAHKFVNFHKLKKFATDIDDSSDIFKAIRLAPGCRLTSDVQTTGFDYLKENPATSGLW